MKKRLLFLLILVLLLLSTHYVFSHEGEEEEEFMLDHSELYPISQLQASGYGILIFGVYFLVF